MTEQQNPPPNVPVFELDFYSDEFISDPHPHYVSMRRLGSVVWLSAHGNYALTRYHEVRTALKNTEVIASGHGVAGDAKGCQFMKGNTLASDEPEHNVMRTAMAQPLLPSSLEQHRQDIHDKADQLIAELVQSGRFEGMERLAAFLPLNIVTELVGLPERGRANMLRWAAAGFNILGIQNERGRAGIDTVEEMRTYIRTEAVPEKVRPGSWTDRIFKLAQEGEIPHALCPSLIRDYIGPSLDTTIAATGQLMFQLGRSPDSFELLKEKPELIPNAINEAVRLASPIRSLTRHVTRDHMLGGSWLPARARVMMLYASANRDELAFEDPEKFDVTRTGPPHLGFGHGSHTCVGMHLARMEMEALLHALIRRVDNIEVGEPKVALNNTIASFSHLPIKFTAKVAPSTGTTDAATPLPRGNWRTVEIISHQVVAEDVVALELAARSGEQLAPFSAGSHIDVEVSAGVIRQYSLCNDPVETHRYRLGVLLEPNSKGGSEAIHSKVAKGAEIRIGEPRNYFPLLENADHTLLLAGGIGITPLMAMAYRLRQLGSHFDLHYCVRTRGRAAFRDELRSMLGDRLHLHIDDEGGRNSLDLKQLLTDAGSKAHVYACGPTGFLTHIRETAKEAGRPDHLQHFEFFAADPEMSGQPFRIVANRSGKELFVPSDKSILEVLTEAGIPVASSCHAGVCGSCITDVVEGVPDHRDHVLTTDEKDGNRKITVCCSRSLSEVLVLDI